MKDIIFFKSYVRLDGSEVCFFVEKNFNCNPHSFFINKFILSNFMKEPRKIELKQRYIFIAFKNKSFRTIRVKEYDAKKAEEKVRQKYPGWVVKPYSAN